MSAKESFVEKKTEKVCQKESFGLKISFFFILMEIQWLVCAAHMSLLSMHIQQSKLPLSIIIISTMNKSDQPAMQDYKETLHMHTYSRS